MPSGQVALSGAGVACHTTDTGPAYQPSSQICADPPFVHVALMSLADAALTLIRSIPTATTTPTKASRCRR